MIFEEELLEVNQRLKVARSRVAIFIRDNRLWLRATLPPKPNSNKTKPYQQYVGTGAKTTIAGLKYAERKAKEMSVSLDAGNFKWSAWSDLKNNEDKTFGELIEEYHAYRLSKSKVADSTWKSDYLLISKKLPSDLKVDLGEILSAIALTEPDSRVRKRLVDYCGRLARFGKFSEKDLEKISEMVGNYSAASVNPRNLPSDEKIVDFVLSIKNPGWRWVVGAIAAYGLRSHEAIRLEVLDFPADRHSHPTVATCLKMRVSENSKTGDRIVRPLRAEWAEDWKLGEIILPDFESIDVDNGKLGTKISGWFRNHAPFNALDLRHCYARRCFEFGLSADISAKFMGHSSKVHQQTYQAWFGEKVYDEAYQKAIGNSATN
jgi:integrase